MKLYCYWVEYMRAYRLYNSVNPDQTIAYGTLEEFEAYADDLGVELILVDLDSRNGQ